MKILLRIIAILLLCSAEIFGQSVTIYRAGVFVETITTSPQIENAVAAALSGDSLVISPHHFRERRVKINKDIIIQGTQTSTDSSIIESSTYKSIFYVLPSSTLSTKVVFRDIIVQNAYLACTGGGYTSHDLALDSLYGAGIKAYERTDVTISGNSIFRNCIIKGDCVYTYYASPDTGMLGGAAIYSKGKLTINGNTKFVDNNITVVYGGAICSVGEIVLEGNVLLDNNWGSLGGSIAVAGKATIKGNVKIINNFSRFGGGIYARYCELNIGDNVQIVNNRTADNTNGAGIYAFHSNLSLQSRVFIAENFGGGIAMESSSFTMKDSVVIALNVNGSNSAAGIYNKGGSINISGGQIIGNYYYYDTIPGKGMAIYNDTFTSSSTPTVKIANARIFNPINTLQRSSEVFNAGAVNFVSDSAWWGESDTSGLIINDGSASTTLNSWVIANWSLNNGVPTGSATNFPIDAYFTLNSGAPLPSKMFWMLAGIYQSDSGSFTPDVSPMLSTNYISTIYNAPYTTQLVNIRATVDADTFLNTLNITGLDIPSVSLLKSQNLNIYPNPSDGNFMLSLSGGLMTAKRVLKIYDLLGRLIHNEELPGSAIPIHIFLKAHDGLYIIELQGDEGDTYRQRIEIKN